VQADTRSTLPGLECGPTCADALDDLPDAESFEELLESDTTAARGAWGKPSDYARAMRCEAGKGWHFGYRRIWEPHLLTASSRTDHTPISRRRFAATAPGTVEPISRFYKLPPLGVSNTLRAGSDSARGAFTSPRPIHYRYPRCITVREMARLHGFPDWFRFHITKWHGARQIGNAVPPPLARAIASRLLAAMACRPTPPKTEIALGELKLLTMDMTEASRFWGIPVPIGRRDRKSGARKRSQSEIEAQLQRRLSA
jgi:DNA (cytosine-5)-methyltransferase 1